ncbi:sugar phosphate isomerase/epimerase family protein [Gehongia tenuis]|uniref:Sugar phosphate isomerase/epimerase n=1 Tax=Gehongia tenuis TaxID=2763655 RepID=A0A926HP02_9FIRM|nr:sugar phosphate isomerase/epimerase [Gehongia tenuis]MBC8530703.1 sugar phosphate isomerase/epimerase [Gehongia tenuis]
MKLGAYTPEIKRGSVEEVFAAIRDYGFEAVQFDYLSHGGVELPERVDGAMTDRIRAAAEAAGIEIAAINGTYNMASPDPAVREEGFRGFSEVARSAKALGCRLLTLCTGSRNPDSMWRWHDDNDSPEAWRDMVREVERAAALAEELDLLLGIEIEASNVVHSPVRARQLFDDMASKSLKLIYDGANLFSTGDVSEETVLAVMARTFDLFEEDIALVHGKDLARRPGVHFAVCGEGIVDFDYFLERCRKMGYTGPMIIHGVKEEDKFPRCAAYMKERIERAGLG